MSGSNQAPVFALGRFAAFAAHPVSAVNVGDRSAPAFADLDGDGDLDLVVGNFFFGTLRAYERTASGFGPFATDPVAGIGAGANSAPTFADVDGDRDLDLVVGNLFGVLRAFELTASGFVPFPVADIDIRTPAFAGIDVGDDSKPAFGDLDGDGDLDLVVGARDGTLRAYERTASGFAPFAIPPLAGIDVGTFSAPALGDLDGDGDLDLVVGERYGRLFAYERTVSGFTAFAANPFAGIDVGTFSTPTFADLDGDGDLDLVVGNLGGALAAFENQTRNQRLTFAENGTGVVLQRAATDPDGTAITWSLGGADAALFAISNTGAVTFRTAPNFEAPRDQGADNIYDLTVIASDGTLSTPLEFNVTITDVNDAPVFALGPFAAFAANPVAVFNGGFERTPTFADLDGDGDLDLVVGERYGTLLAYERMPSGFVPFAATPFPGIDVGFTSAPAFTDLDGDGDLDLVVGDLSGRLRGFERTASGFVSFAVGPFAGIDVGFSSTPAFADLDGDGDLDLVVGESAGTLQAFERTASGFTTFAANPLAGITVAYQSTAAFADLDGDGDLDLVVGAYDGTLRAFERTASGFTAFTANPFAGIDVGDQSAPAFADLDGDGDLDLVVGERLGTLVAFENRTPSASVTFAENGTGVVFQRAATDPDGTAITWSLGGADAALFAISNTGAVTFRTAPDFEAPRDQGGNNIFDLTVIAADGTLSTPLAITVTVTDVNEAPAFALGPFAAFTASPFASIDVGFDSTPTFADLDGDGDLDLVVGESSGTLRALERTASGFTAFAANPVAGIDVGYYAKPTFADLDSDGDLDLVVGNLGGTLRAFERTPSGFGSTPLATDPFASIGIGVGLASAPAFTDLDGDGDLDLVVGNIYGTLRAFERTASGFTAFAANPFGGINLGSRTSPTFADLDSDGDLDLVVGAQDGTLRAFERTASGFTAFAANPVASIDVGFNSTPAFGDLDGDGDLDLVMGNFGGTLVPFANRTPSANVNFAENGTGVVFQRAATDPEGTAITWSLGGADAALFAISNTGAVTFMTAPDFEAPSDQGGNNVYDLTIIASDGTLSTPLDVTVTVTDVNEAPVFALGPFTAFTADPIAFIDAGGSNSPTFADLDGDGDLDLVVGNRLGTLVAFERTASGFTAIPPAANPFARIDVGFNSAPAFADLDGDGDLDFVVGEYFGTLRAFERTPSGFGELLLAANPFAGIDVGYRSAPAFADLDGDGDLDLVVGAADGTLRAYERTPSGFGSTPLATDPFASISVGSTIAPAFGDLDGDGDLDLVVGAQDGTVRAYERTASGFAPFAANPFAGIDVGVFSAPAFADLDGDGDLDLMVGERYGTLRAFENRTPSASVTFAENSKGVVFQRAATDPQGDPITWSLGGADAALFAISSDGAVTFFAAPDFENPQDANGDNVHDLTVIASDGTLSTPLDVTITVTDVNDVNEAPVFALGPFAAFAADPVAGIRQEADAAPAFADLDGDGDLDLVLGYDEGKLLVFERTASGFAATPLAANPFAAIDVGARSTPTFTDLDGDGDLDLVVGAENGTLRAFERTPSGFADFATDPFAGFYGGLLNSAPAFTDLDGDGDLDLVVGERFGQLAVFERTPSGFAATPVAGLVVGSNSAPAFGDLDGDGDLDLVVGAQDGTLRAFERTASGFTAFGADPVAGINLGSGSKPAFADLDGDGDLDLVVGNLNFLVGDPSSRTLVAFENQSQNPRVTFAENGTGVVFQRAATDPQGTAIIWSLGGADAALFAISNTGAVTFTTAPDFEAPRDQGGDNVYDLTVIASDGTLSTPLDVTVTVTNMNDAPTGRVDLAFIAGALVADASSLADVDGLGVVSIAWQSSANGGATWADIPGATGPSFTPGTAEAGLLLRAEARYTDGAGIAEAVASVLLALVGTAGRDTLEAGKVAVILLGLGDRDALLGGLGADIMAGGADSDFYEVNHTGDIVLEGAGGGAADLVFARIDYTLPGQVERLQLLGTADLNGSGNELDNWLDGNAGANRLDGGLGNDRLDGRAGADTMLGGAGDERYAVDNPGDVVIEFANEGNDRVVASIDYTLPEHVERLSLSGTDNLSGTGQDGANRLDGNAGNNLLRGLGGNDLLLGDAGADTLEGGSGADQLVGGLGADSMVGGTENDIYEVDDAGDVVVEQAGGGAADLVRVWIDYTLPGQVERLALLGTADLNGSGNELDNWLDGNAGANRLEAGGGNDRLDGRGGADTMLGGAGDERYVVDDPGDVVIEFANEGNDRVVASIDYTLPEHVERLSLSGTGDLSGTGQDGANRLDGNAGHNLLRGLGGNDLLLGGAGADTLEGGDGADRIDGGLGADSMEGGAGADIFRFLSVVEAQGDVITDFSPATGDRIDLRSIDANPSIAGDQAFAWIGGLVFGRVAGELRFANGKLEGDVDGDGTPDFQIGLTGVASLTPGSIWL